MVYPMRGVVLVSCAALDGEREWYAHAAKRNQSSSETEGSDERREGHGAREDEVGEHPGGSEVWFEPAEGGDERRDAGWRARREAGLLVVVGRSDDPGQEHRAGEGDDGEGDEREAAHAPDVAERVFGGARGLWRVVAEVGLAHPGGAVE